MIAVRSYDGQSVSEGPSGGRDGCGAHLAAVAEHAAAVAPAEERDGADAGVKRDEEERADVAVLRAGVEVGLGLGVAGLDAADDGEDDADGAERAEEVEDARAHDGVGVERVLASVQRG